MEHVKIEVSDQIAVVAIDRPPVNARSHQTFTEIPVARTYRTIDGRFVALMMIDDLLRAGVVRAKPSS